MAGPIPFHEFKRKMSVLGIDMKQGNKATHFVLTKNVGDHKKVYVVARHGNEVKRCYVEGVLKAFQVSQKEFDQA